MGFLDDLSDSERDREGLWQENPNWGDVSNQFGVPYDIGSRIRSAPGNAASSVWDTFAQGTGAADMWDFLQGAATGFPDRTSIPGFDQLTASEMDREWAPPVRSELRGRTGPSQAELAQMVAALQSQQPTLGDPNGGWWDRMQDRVYNFGDDVVGSGFVGGLGDAAGWAADQAGRLKGAGMDAWGNLTEGDLSEAVGDLLGGYYDVNRNLFTDVTAPALGYLGQEAGQLAGDFGDNIYSNWGLEDALNATGRFGQRLPGYGMDALGYLGGQAADLGQAGLGQLVSWGTCRTICGHRERMSPSGVAAS